VSEGGAEVVAVDAGVVGQLQHRAVALVAVADEGKRILLLRTIGRAQQSHAHDAGVEVDRALQVTDAQHGVEDSHRMAPAKGRADPRPAAR
jgi:hypothetical protein